MPGQWQLTPHADVWVDVSEGGIIGKGHEGEVRAGIAVDSGAVMAVKVWTGGYGRGLLDEAATLSKIDHRNVIRADLQHNPVTGVPCLIMPRAECSLEKQVKDHGPISERQARRIARGLAAGLRACHLVGVAHMDVNPRVSRARARSEALPLTCMSCVL